MTPILISTYDRPDLLRGTLQTLFESVESPIQVIVADDGSPNDKTRKVLDMFPVRQLLLPHQGLVHSLNALFAEVKRFAEERMLAPFWIYCQDDLRFSPGWLQKMFAVWDRWAEESNFGLLTCVEDAFTVINQFEWEGMHIQIKHFAEGHLYFAPKDFWVRTTPIPILNGDGTERGFPCSGIGSNVDWHFLRDSPKSLSHLKKKVGVIPGLVTHTGNENSTW